MISHIVSKSILVIYSALYLQNMDMNLLPPTMMGLAGLDVDEFTKFLLIKLTESNNSLYFPMSYIRLPLQLEGTILYIPTRKRMKVELKESEVKYMLLTPNTPKWEPHTTIYRDQEHVILD